MNVFLCPLLPSVTLLHCDSHPLLGLELESDLLSVLAWVLTEAINDEKQMKTIHSLMHSLFLSKERGLVTSTKCRKMWKKK